MTSMRSGKPCSRYPLWLVALVLGSAGCGSGQPSGDVVPTVPAAGVLTYRGQPLEHHQVLVYPSSQRPAAGVTDANGRFVLGTNREGDGAPVGTHQVTVTYVGPPNLNPEEATPLPPPKVKIPAKYRNVKTSGLQVEIPEGGSQDLKIELQ